MIELACETTVPLQSTEFAALAHDLAMQIAAQDPANISSLIHQKSIKDPDKSVYALLESAEQYFSERIQIIRFIRWSIEDPEPVEGKPPPKRPAKLMRAVK